MLDNNLEQLLLKETSNYKFFLVRSTKQIVEELQKLIYNTDEGGEIILDEETLNKYPFIKQIEVLGKSSHATEEIARHFIPVQYLHQIQVEGTSFQGYYKLSKKEYQCYCRGVRIPENNIIIHESPLSSLRCALYRIGSPEYSYIIKERKEEENHKPKIEDYATNASGNPTVCETSEDVGKSES